MAAVPRRQGRRDRVRRLYGADAAPRCRRWWRSFSRPSGRRNTSRSVRSSRRWRCRRSRTRRAARCRSSRLRARPRRSSSSAIDRIWRVSSRARSAGSESARDRGCTTVKTAAVLGAGSWGTALAVHLGRIGHDVHALGARRGACRRHPRAARERRLPAGHRSAVDGRCQRSRSRRRVGDAELVVMRCRRTAAAR